MKKQDNAIIGIYKIISPSGKVYIGQSKNIEHRHNQYKLLHCQQQPKLYNSLKKHGWDKHTVEILEECILEQLDELFPRVIFFNRFFDTLID